MLGSMRKKKISCEEVIKINFESVAPNIEKSILLVDKETSNTLAAVYKLESFITRFAPLLFQALPVSPKPPITLAASSNVVFMISSYLWDYWDLIRKTVRELAFPPISPNSPHPKLKVTVYCGISEESHQNLRPDFAPSNTTAYKFARKDLEQVFIDLSLKGNTTLGTVIVTVKHLPALSLHPIIGGEVFLSASGRDVFPATMHYIDPETMNLHEESLSAPWKEQIHLNATCIASLLGMSGVAPGKAHFWGLGSSAKYLGHLLSDAQYNSYEVNGNYSDAGVIIIDRTMDLVAPTAHSDHLIHRILSILPPRSEPSDDIHVNMGEIFDSAVTPRDKKIKIETGRLLEVEGHKLLAELVKLKHKDSLIMLRKKFVDVITDEEIPVNISTMMRGAVNVKQLQSFIGVFKDNTKLIFKYPGLLQLIEASLLTLKLSKEVFWDQLLSTEKVIQLNALAENSETIAKQLTDMLLHPIPGSHSYYPVQIVLQLAIFAYSLCGSTSENLWDDEISFKEALADALIQRSQAGYTLNWLGFDLNRRIEEYQRTRDSEHDQSKEMALKMELLDKFGEIEILEKLHSFRSYRKGLEDYNTLLIQKGTSCQYKSQVSQILEHIYHPDKPALHDLELIQSSLSGLLRSGLGRFGLKSKPHPANHSLLIIYLLGGITMPEVKEIKELTKDKDQKVFFSLFYIFHVVDSFGGVTNTTSGYYC